MIAREDEHEGDRAEMMRKFRKLYEESRLAQIETMRKRVEERKAESDFTTGGGFGMYGDLEREIPPPTQRNIFTRQTDKSVETFGNSLEFLFGTDDMPQKAADFFGVQRRYINYMLDRDCIPGVYLMAVAHLVEIKLRGENFEGWREAPLPIPFTEMK